MNEGTNEVVETEVVDTEVVETATEATDASVETPSDDEVLGPQGIKALQAEKERRKAESARRRELEAELGALKAQTNKVDGENLDIDAIRAKAREDALKEVQTETNRKVVEAQVKAAAAAKLADPSDALRFIDISHIETEEDAIDAVQELVNSKPYLGVQAPRFQGTADQGVRQQAGPTQLTRADLTSMTPAEIERARVEGRLTKLLGG